MGFEKTKLKKTNTNGRNKTATPAVKFSLLKNKIAKDKHNSNNRAKNHLRIALVLCDGAGVMIFILAKRIQVLHFFGNILFFCIFVT